MHVYSHMTKIIPPDQFRKKLIPNTPFIAYTDGACRGNPGPGGWGAVIIQNGIETEISGYSASTTNNKMEMQAAIEVLSLIPINSTITITTDSQYLKQGIESWIRNWKRNGWKLHDGSPVKNYEYWTKIDELSNLRNVRWEWVKGHHGHPFNERADKLATSAIDNTGPVPLNQSAAVIPQSEISTSQKPQIKRDPNPNESYQTVSLDEFLQKHKQTDICYIYTDGACSRNPGPGGWGAVLQQNGIEVQMCGGEKNTSNNRMELTAMIKAVSCLPLNSVIHLTTDSMYLKDGVTKWLKNWKIRGWKTSQNQDVKNKDLWLTIDEINQNYQIHFDWVKGHNDHPQNERCDQLAVASIPDF